MKKREFEFYIGIKKIRIQVKECRSILSKILGLMFSINKDPLLFIFEKEKNISIHSFFCKPFFAIWLSSSRKIRKILKISKWKANFSGKGKYLLEIPKYDENYSLMTKLANLSDVKK